jgi:CRISPR-associated protein Cmr3
MKTVYLKTVYLTITLHDPIIARDGRPFGAGQGIRMKSLDWPYPSVLAGSLRTLMGKAKSSDFDPETVESLKKISIYGPLPLYGGKIYIPAPKDILVRDDGNNRDCFAIRPVALRDGTGCNLPSGGLLPSTIPESVDEEFKPAGIPAFWSMDRMIAWLTDSAGDSFSAPPDPEEIGKCESCCGLRAATRPSWPLDSEKAKKCKELIEKCEGFINGPERDPRIHVKIDPDLGSSDEGMLFETVGLDLSLKGSADGIGIAARVEADDNWGSLAEKIDSLHTIGGERRLANWKAEKSSKAWDCPESICNTLEGKNRIRMVLATPAIFSQGWLPGWLHEVNGSLKGTPPGATNDLGLKLVSACVDRWRPISGWSLESKNKGNRPKPVRRLATAGSVYFFEVLSGDAKKLAKELWMKPVSDEAQDRQDGFGIALWGVWGDASGLKKNEKREEV